MHAQIYMYINRYVRIQQRMAETIETLKFLSSADDNGSARLEEDLYVSVPKVPSTGWQYLGLPIAPLVTLMNQALLVMDPGLSDVSPALSPTRGWADGLGVSGNVIEGRRGREGESSADSCCDDSAVVGGSSAAYENGGYSAQKRIRLGIVMERRGGCASIS